MRISVQLAFPEPELTKARSDALNAVKRLLPVRTGRLRDSASLSGGDITISAPYAAYVLNTEEALKTARAAMENAIIGKEGIL